MNDFNFLTWPFVRLFEICSGEVVAILCLYIQAKSIKNVSWKCAPITLLLVVLLSNVELVRVYIAKDAKALYWIFCMLTRDAMFSWETKLGKRLLFLVDDVLSQVLVCALGRSHHVLTILWLYLAAWRIVQVCSKKVIMDKCLLFSFENRAASFRKFYDFSRSVVVSLFDSFCSTSSFTYPLSEEELCRPWI